LDTQTFLRTIWDDTSWHVIQGIKQGLPSTVTWHQTVESAVKELDRLENTEYDAYYAVSNFENNTERSQSNVKSIGASYLDIDCGEGKFYATQEQGIDALVGFVSKYNLPVPTVISSGNGLHVYWFYTTPAPRKNWKLIAEALKVACRSYGLVADAAITADEARLLRPVGTSNKKRSPWVMVEWLLDGKEVDYQEFGVLVGLSDALSDTLEIPDYISRELTPLQKSLRANSRNRFSLIIDKTTRSAGCEQLGFIVARQSEVGYALWRAGLSIAANCVDAGDAIHIMSEDHPQYSRSETEKMADGLLDKPYLCATIAHLRPDVCQKCQHWEKIKSPITLGEEIEFDDGSSPILHIAARGTPSYYTPPPVPDPYKRGKNGGIYLIENEEFTPVYEHDFYLVKRMHEGGRGDSVLARLHLPREAPREFVIPLATMSSKEELRKLLSYHGIIALAGQIDRIMKYLVLCAKTQQVELDIEVLRTQFGWADDNTKFVLGTQEFGMTEIKYSPPSEITARLSKDVRPKGTLTEWSRVANAYDRVGFEPHAFGLLTGFGAPLMKFTGYNGAWINLLHPESGTGKTTILKMVNSIIGHPEALLSKESDTMAHKKFRLGLHNNLAFTMDEMTNVLPAAVSNFAYEVTQGEGAGRMQSQVNMERTNDTHWSTLVISSSNSSLIQKLGTIKSTANGEVMRLLEYAIPPSGVMTKNEAYQLYEGVMYQNYGVAGPIYIDWLVKNQEVAIALMLEVQKKIDILAGLANKERYVSAVVAANITGGIIACDLGLIKYDIDKIINWVVMSLIPEWRKDVINTVSTYDDVLGEFLNANLGTTLVVNNEMDLRSGLFEAPFLEPRYELSVRIEVDEKLIYIDSKTFKRYCTKEQVVFKDLLNILHKKGIYKGESRKRLTRGTKMVAPAVQCYCFTFRNEDVFGAESLIVNVSPIPSTVSA